MEGNASKEKNDYKGGSKIIVVLSLRSCTLVLVARALAMSLILYRGSGVGFDCLEGIKWRQFVHSHFVADDIVEQTFYIFFAE